MQKQKVLQESGATSQLPDNQKAQKVMRQFAQTRPVADKAGERNRPLSKDILAGVSVLVFIGMFSTCIFLEYHLG